MESILNQIFHCNIGPQFFGRRAEAVSQELCLAFPDIRVEVNLEKPRRNSFEVVLLKKDGTKIELWSGLKKGPPRKLKFPEPSNIVEMVKHNLN
uniref:Selenoprotein H n=1 Tax=Naja naja TaxID=35670 RepID=A0A8C6VF62_NAJNA